MFDIQNSVAFYNKMIEDFDDLSDDPESSRHAINCAITAFHLAEWIWGDWLQSDHDAWRVLGIRSKSTFIQWVHENQPWFAVVQDITNGSKHFARNIRNTQRSGSYVEQDYVDDNYQTQVLEVEAEVNGHKRWIEVVFIIEDVVMFWHRFLKQYRPEAVLKEPKFRFTEDPT